MTALVVAASLLIGVSLGILGGGGSILTVPILVYLAGQDTKEAIATSLFVVGVTSLAALVPHARARRVRWRTGLLFGAFSMLGAYGGGRLAEYIPGTALLVAFALMMLATAVAMLRKPRNSRKKARPAHSDLPMKHIAVEGLVVGAVTGLVGSGGGFLVVPALAILGGLPMGIAVGTSLLVIAMKSFAGLAGHLSGVAIDWRLALTVTAAAVVGSLVGGRLAGRIPQDAMRKAFGWFVVVMSVFVLAQQLDTAVWAHPVTWAGLGVALAAAVAARLRRSQHPPRPHSAASGPQHATLPEKREQSTAKP
ncbi:sulfite exporter TauE/SafE family protein [Streptomyces sp. JV185]|uniref:sulfite exporter TauE/SafE family protein n=1 Tax=Streptomyces sp. JV185 TaxID=858638 RepID=UPI002E76A86F|nr:sulfite exporter TauE/SafE family protein [Streptomyces sp. JV185]MEE1768950.1 sulfite exporter TauE/SafE family protein [Streptomyces sp. JV185]